MGEIFFGFRFLNLSFSGLRFWAGCGFSKYEICVRLVKEQLTLGWVDIKLIFGSGSNILIGLVVGLIKKNCPVFDFWKLRLGFNLDLFGFELYGMIFGLGRVLGWTEFG